MSEPVLSKPGFLAPLTVNEFIDQVLLWAEQGCASEPPRVIAYLNAHTTNLAHRNPAYRGLLERADLRYADGMAVVRAARELGIPLPERVNAGDFLTRFLWAAADRSIRVALVGSEVRHVEGAARHLERKVPHLEFALTHHGHFAPGGEEERALVSALRDCGARIVLVGMGSPRQEQWALGAGQECGGAVIWCVGALFEYCSGLRPRAPVWMRQAGLEWLFRLLHEPRRLARRYLIGNVEFLWRARQEKRRRLD